jgi:hypothetical protein
MRILLCTNGSSHTARALKMGVRVAQRAASDVNILVVAERDREKEARRMAETAAADLEPPSTSGPAGWPTRWSFRHKPPRTIW